MEKLVESLGITKLSKSQVSIMAAELDAQVADFRNRFAARPALPATAWPRSGAGVAGRYSSAMLDDVIVGGASLAELLGRASGHPGVKCTYSLFGVGAGEDSLAKAVAMIADDAMRQRCGASAVLTWWRERRDGGPPHSLQRRPAVEAFIKDTFGLPEAPGDEQLLQGYVAELVWHRLTREDPDDGTARQLHHVTDLSWSVYQQGGDGLVVYQVEDGRLAFRLWEIKKHDSTAHLSRTVGRASKQLSSNALRYLAQYTGYGSTLSGPLGQLFGELVELWVNEDPRAGVGVSIATSARHTPKRQAFGGLATAFPRLETSQREGLLVVVEDFPAFAVAVRDIVWTGL
jgi:hypothetical protein